MTHASPARDRRGRPRSFRDRRTLLGGLVAGMLVGLVLLAWTGLQSHAVGSQPLPTAGTLRAVGRVTAVGASSGAGATEFTLQTVGGEALPLEIAAGSDTGVPSGWLQQRETSGALVQVTYHLQAGRDIVDHLGEAPTPTPPSPGGTP